MVGFAGGALIAVLAVEQPEHLDRPPVGFDGAGVGVEVNASVAMSGSSGTNGRDDLLLPQWEVGLRLRIGEFFSIGASAELFHGLSGGPGEEWDYQRREIGVDVQWRFWGYRGLLRPWLGVGMAWGDIHSFHVEELGYAPIDAHVWEFLRLSAGLDVVPAANLAIGPWYRFGLATTHGPYDAGTSLRTSVFGLRVAVALP